MKPVIQTKMSNMQSELVLRRSSKSSPSLWILSSFCLFVIFIGYFLFLTGDEWDYIMSEVQGTLEFSVELHKFHNVDLFQRG